MRSSQLGVRTGNDLELKMNQAERSKRTLSPRRGESARRPWTNEDAQIPSSPNMEMRKSAGNDGIGRT